MKLVSLKVLILLKLRHILKLTYHYTYPFESPFSKSKTLGAFAHPPFESAFKHCLLRGPQCQSTAAYFILIARIVVQNQIRSYKHVYTCQAGTQYVQAEPVQYAAW